MGLRLIRLSVRSMIGPGDRRVGIRVPLVQALMRTAGVVVECVLGQDPAQMPWPEDEDLVQELTT
jgi:hypothetical protein